MIYLVESREETLRRPGGITSVGVPAAGYQPQIYLHLLDLTEDEVANVIELTRSGRPRVGSPGYEWWFGDHAKAYWPGIKDPQIHSENRPMQDILARRRR